MTRGAWLATVHEITKGGHNWWLTHAHFIIATESMTFWGSVIDTSNLYYVPLNKVFKRRQLQRMEFKMSLVISFNTVIKEKIQGELQFKKWIYQ